MQVMKQKKNQLKEIIIELKKQENKKDKKILERFFKTGEGEYGEGDVFLGIRVPKQRKIAKKYLDLTKKEIEKLLNSKYHEFRMTGLIILIEKYQKGNEKTKKQIVKTYKNNFKNINNWDLVDVSAPKIFGDYLLKQENKKTINKILTEMSTSKNMWERRIAIISTLTFIKNNQFKQTIKLSKKYLKDKEDLMHKATGWMLREIGKKEKTVLINFLEENHQIMPRTMLRYSLEKLTEKEKEKYMKKN